MKLELFTKKGTRSGLPRVSISKAGQIGINSACLEKYFNGRKYVLLYSDKHNKIIAIKPIEKEHESSFTISYSAQKTTGSISGHSFLKHAEIDFKKETKGYLPEWDDKEGMLIIKLT